MVDATARSAMPAGVEPTLTTPFIGRQEEIVEVIDLLGDPTCRLLTLVGPGGIGKTRLAVEAAARLEDSFANGVHLVLLQSVRSTEFLVSAMADVLNVSLHGHDVPRDQLLAYLKNRETLLILDNFEQLIGAPAIDLLMAILRTAPAVKLLVTSREVLSLQEEWLYPVQGLSLPTQADGTDAHTTAAVQLFVERARRMQRDFSLEEELNDVVRICRLVEGMPLALELAASWVQTLHCAEIADEIERNKDFLATRFRNVPARHRSMQAVFDQTWARLSEVEQRVFTHLSIFRGGFRREAAEAIAGATISVLSALVDKCLLRKESDGRYHVHELLRQYAEERLNSTSPEAHHIYDRHCTFYADYLHARDADMNGGRQRAATAEIAAELDNVRAAWQWAVERDHVAAIHKSADALYLFYQFQSRYQEAADAFENAVRALSRDESAGRRAEVLAQVLVHQAWLYIRLGRLDEARAALEQSRTLHDALDVAPPPTGMATDPLIPLSMLAVLTGDSSEAVELGKTVRIRAEARKDTGNLMFSFYVLTIASLAEGTYDAAQRYARHAHRLARDKQNRWFMAYSLNELGNVARVLGNFEEAKHHYEASYAIREEFDDPEGMAVALNHLGEIAVLRGAYRDARRLFRKSCAIYDDIGDRGGLATAYNGLASVACGLGRHDDARRYLYRALQIATEAQIVPLTLSVLLTAGELLLRTEYRERGMKALTAALRHPAGDRELRERAHNLLARHDVGPAAPESGPAGDLEPLTAWVQSCLADPGELSTSDVSFEPRHVKAEDQPLIEPLTPRELEVLELLATGLSNPEIADELVIAIGTVKTHTHRIYGKLDVDNRTQAAARARELDLV